LEQAADVDSLTVTWPSGIVDKLYDLPTNQTVQVVEGSTSNLVTVSKEEENRPIFYQNGNVLVSPNIEVKEWRVYSTSGQLVASSNAERAPISHLPKGVYTVIAEQNSEIPLIRKVFIQ
jgi:hypothetical protein